MGKFPRDLDENARATPHGRMVFSVFISHFISSPFSNEAFSNCLSRGRDHSQTETQFRREPALMLWHTKMLERSEE